MKRDREITKLFITYPRRKKRNKPESLQKDFLFPKEKNTAYVKKWFNPGGKYINNVLIYISFKFLMIVTRLCNILKGDFACKKVDFYTKMLHNYYMPFWHELMMFSLFLISHPTNMTLTCKQTNMFPMRYICLFKLKAQYLL